MELEIIKTIQLIANPFFDFFFELSTILGEELLIIPLLAILYWTINKKFGEYVGFAIFTSFMANNLLKDIFKLPRPQSEQGVRILRQHTATGYAFPSGHTQGAATFYSAIAIAFKNKMLAITVGIIIVLVALSRLYLGVHFPKDVIVGLLLGVAIAWGCYILFEKMDNLKVYGLILIVFVLFLGVAQSSDYIKALGSYTGFVLGIIMEKKYVRFSVNGLLWKKVLRVLIGVAIAFAIRSGLKVALPEQLISDFFRYFVLTLFSFGVYPAIFKKINL